MLLLSQLIYSSSQVSILDLKKQAGDYRLDFLIWDDNGLANQVNKSDLKLSLNSATANFNLVNNTTSADISNKSILISLDISNAYNYTNFDIAKQGLLNLFPRLNYFKPELALSTYNTTAYLNQDLTTDYSKLVYKLPYISLFGASNFENVFFHSFAGSANVFKNAVFEKHIVIIADSYSESNINSIKDYLEQNNVNCYLIYFNDIAPPSLVNLTKSTNRFKIITTIAEQKSFDFALDKVIKEIYKLIPFNLSFNSKICNDSLELGLSYLNQQYDLNFSIPEIWKSNLKPITNNTIAFAKVESQIPKDTIVEFFSEFDSIIIQNINTNSLLLKYSIIDSLAFDKKSAKVKFTYQTADTSYFKTTIAVQSTACKVLSFNFEAGTKTKLNNNSTIRIVAPKPNERLIAGNPAIIRWEGTNPKDIFKLEYTSNDGLNWNLISETATSNSFNWNVPNTAAQYRIRISELAKINIYEKVLYFTVPNNTYIDNISWGSEDILAFSTDKGELYTINPFTQLSPKKISSDLKKINDLKFGKSGTKIATSIDASTSNSNLIIFDADEVQPPVKLLGNLERPKSLEWNKQSNMIFSGDFNGNLDIWNMTNPSSQTLTFPLIHNGAINSIAYSEKKNLLITTGNDSWLKFRSSLNWQIFNDTLTLNYGNNDVAVSMKLTNDDNNLYLVTKNSLIYYYDLFKNDTIFSPSLRFSNKINNLQFNHISTFQNKLLYTASSSISLTNQSNQVLFSFTGHDNQISSFDVNKNGFVASADIRGGLQIWNINDFPFEKKILETNQSNNFQVVDINLKIENINLGNYCLGKVQTNNISKYILNEANASLVIDSIKINNDINSEFNITNIFPITIKSKSSFDLQIDFAPKTEGTKFLEIIVYAGNFSFKKLLTAVGYDPRYIVENSTIDFGNINYDQTKLLSNQLKITNSGTVNLKIINFEYQSKDTIFKLTQNNLPVNVPVDIAPSKSVTFEVSFLPKNIERYNALLRFNTQETCTPIFVSLLGTGVAPAIKQNNFILDKINCANEMIDTILNITNTGKGILEIESIKQVSGNSNCKLILIKNSAKPNENIILRCSYIDNGIKKDSNVFELLTNKLENGNNKHTIAILSQKDSIGVYTKDTTINFIVSTINTNASKTISVKNTGTISIDWSKEIFLSEYFELKSITPIICQPNEYSQFEFYFTGSDKDTSLQASYLLSNKCKNQIINLFAIIGSKETNISFNPTYDLGLLECNQPYLIKVAISNIGQNELLVKNIRFENDNLNELNLISPTTNILTAKETFEIEILVTPKQLITKDIDLIIETNAKNAVNGISKIKISFERIQNTFETTNVNIDINDIIVNTIRNFTYSLKYTGNKPLTITTPVILTNNFTLDSIIPKVIEPDSTAIFYFTLNALQEGKVNSHYNFSNNCKDSLNLIFNAIVIGSNFIKVTMPQISSKTGDIVSLKAQISNPKQHNLTFLDSSIIEFRVNNSIAIPKFEWASDTLIDGIRYTKTIFNPNQEYKYLTTLGDSNLTIVNFMIKPISNPESISIFEESGKITLTDVCYEGNSRYVISTGNFTFSTPFPNPCDIEVHFEINAIEKGKYVLDLYDEMGNFVKNLFSKELNPSSYSIKNNVFDVPIGGYYCKLTTPSELYFRKLIIIR